MAQRSGATRQSSLTWEDARAAQQRAWTGLSMQDQRQVFQQMKADVVAIWQSHGHDVSHILESPDPGSDAARLLGCVCPAPQVGELHMLPDCPVHHYPLGFSSPHP